MRLRICQRKSYTLTKMYLPIYLVTVDNRTKDIFILQIILMSRWCSDPRLFIKVGDL
jgi:hypothetical protein